MESKNSTILGYRLFNSPKETFFKEDFEDMQLARKFLGEVWTGESDLTEEGRRYFLDRFDNSDFLDRLIEMGGMLEMSPMDKRVDREYIRKWMEETAEPRISATFIQAGRSGMNFKLFRELLVRYNPYGLPANEAVSGYDIEMLKIARRFMDREVTETNIEDLVYEAFADSRKNPETENREKYDELAKEIWSKRADLFPNEKF